MLVNNKRYSCLPDYTSLIMLCGGGQQWTEMLIFRLYPSDTGQYKDICLPILDATFYRMIKLLQHWPIHLEVQVVSQ